MNIWVLVDEYELKFAYAGASVLSAHTSENDANDALEAIAKRHGTKVFRYDGHNAYTTFCCDEEQEYDVDHRVYVCQTQLV